MYHQVYNDESLTKDFIEYIIRETNIEVIECREAMTGEDFGYMLAEIPGFMFWLGVESPYGLHHAKLNPKEEAIDVAIEILSSYMTFKGKV
jgi:N-acetyldiaminopimelate deacetylase